MEAPSKPECLDIDSLEVLELMVGGVAQVVKLLRSVPEMLFPVIIGYDHQLVDDKTM